jgi:hypothetical protein
MTLKGNERGDESKANAQALYMVELNHEPETCIASGYGNTESNASLLMKISESAKDLGAELVGGWAFPVGHRQWYVVKADDAHVVAEVIRVTNLHLWNTISVNPVLDHDGFSTKILSKLVS